MSAIGLLALRGTWKLLLGQPDVVYTLDVLAVASIPDTAECSADMTRTAASYFFGGYLLESIAY